MTMALKYIQNLGYVFEGVKFDQLSSYIRSKLLAVALSQIRKDLTWLADCHGAKDNFDILVCHSWDLLILDGRVSRCIV